MKKKKSGIIARKSGNMIYMKGYGEYGKEERKVDVGRIKTLELPIGTNFDTSKELLDFLNGENYNNLSIIEMSPLTFKQSWEAKKLKTGEIVVMSYLDWKRKYAFLKYNSKEHWKAFKLELYHKENLS